MTRIVVRNIIWDEWNIEHIKKHKVSTKDIERAINNLIAHKKGHSGRYILIGRSGQRLISTIVRRRALNTYYVVTARDSDSKERRVIYEKKG